MEEQPSQDRRATPWVVFDGDCGFCTTSADWVAQRLSRPGHPSVHLVPWQRADLESLGTSANRAQQEVLWVTPDGTVRGGAAAFAAWLRFSGRPYSCLGAVMTWPGVRTLAASVYRLVAANRHRLPGGTPACALPSPRSDPSPPGSQPL